mgnify:CR=1 FL=1
MRFVFRSFCFKSKKRKKKIVLGASLELLSKELSYLAVGLGAHFVALHLEFDFLFSLLVLTSGKFLEALGSKIGTCSIFCHSFLLSKNVHEQLIGDF